MHGSRRQDRSPSCSRERLRIRSSSKLSGRIAQLEAILATTCTTLARVTAERDKLRRTYGDHKEQLELLRRRIMRHE